MLELLSPHYKTRMGAQRREGELPVRLLVVGGAVKRSAPLKSSKPLERKTPLRTRTPFARTSSLERNTKPKAPKTKKCANRPCQERYTPDPKQPFKDWCSEDCGAELALKKLAKIKERQAKAERAETRKRKQESMSLQDRKELVQKLANRYAVLRDHAYGCISCDKGPNWQGVWHGSHFKSVGSNSALRYNLLNIHKACSQCNFFQCGNIANYETRLRQKIGDERVDWLKNHPRSREYTHEYLIRLAAILRRKIKRLERRISKLSNF
jgi:hypothetical protein